MNYSNVKSSFNVFYSGVPDNKSLNLHVISLRNTDINLELQFLILDASSITTTSKVTLLKNVWSEIT